jgi:hypothetical protein
MKPPLLAGLAILVVSSLLTRGAEPAGTPTVQAILDRYVDAAGGRAALEKLKTRVMKGTMEATTMGVSGGMEVRSKIPNKQVSSVDLAGLGAMREGFDGAVAWSEAPGLGLRTKTGSELARVQRSMVFPRELKLKDVYERLESKGAGKVGGADTWIVEASSKAGKPDRLFFDQTTGLLVREESAVETPLGEMVFQIDFADYRDG